MRQIHAFTVFETDVFLGCLPTVTARGRQTQHNGLRSAFLLVNPDNRMIMRDIDIKPLDMVSTTHPCRLLEDWDNGGLLEACGNH